MTDGWCGAWRDEWEREQVYHEELEREAVADEAHRRQRPPADSGGPAEDHE